MPETTSHNSLTRRSTGPGKLSLQLPMHSMQIRHQIAFSFSLLLLIVTTAFWLLFQNELNRSLDEYRNMLGASLADQTATSVRELVLVNDLLGLNVVLTQLVRDDNVLFASVHDADDAQIARAGQQDPQAEADFYTASISVQDAIAGTVLIQLDTRSADSYRQRLRNLFLLLLGASMVLVITTAFALAGRITAPVRVLTDAIAGSIGDDDDDDIAADETGRLQHAVDRLLAKYQEMEGQLLETGIWKGNRDDDSSEPARLAASVLVIKVVNIHTAIELLHPAILSGLLQEYLFYLNQAARLYGGEFHRVNGESAVVCFDEETCDDNHSINALYCAGLFQSIMARINKRHRNNGEQMLEFRMAIHSGDIFMAPGVGEQDGKGSILGKTLDITYFLSKQAAPGELVISETASSQAREFEHVEADRQREVSMPADNVTFMAYILSSGFAEDMGMIRKQRRHILGVAGSVNTSETTDATDTRDGDI